MKICRLGLLLFGGSRRLYRVFHFIFHILKLCKKIHFPIVSLEVRGKGKGGIQIFPNPAPSDELTLYLPESNDEKAATGLYNQTGKQALQQTTSSQQETLNVSQLAAGMYFVEVRAGRKVFREKAVVE